MNAKTEKQIENLKNQTIGVEIEMNHITRERAAKLAADFFGTGRYEFTASRNGYSTWSSWDAQGCSIDGLCTIIRPDIWGNAKEYPAIRIRLN